MESKGEASQFIKSKKKNKKEIIEKNWLKRFEFETCLLTLDIEQIRNPSKENMEPSCVRKETVGIDMLVMSRNTNRRMVYLPK